MLTKNKGYCTTFPRTKRFGGPVDAPQEALVVLVVVAVMSMVSVVSMVGVMFIVLTTIRVVGALIAMMLSGFSFFFLGMKVFLGIKYDVV